MKSHAEVVVIGGGIVGCSVLYHLTALGCADVVLCERKELTAGSSWHAAGQIHALNADPGMARLQGYTIDFYRKLQGESGQDVGLHRTGGVLIAETQDRWDFLRAECARQRTLGADTELVTPQQIRDLFPLVDIAHVRGGIFDPREGHVDPHGATLAYAKAARQRGAEVNRQTRVIQLVARSGGGWEVITDRGTILCEHVVNAAGLWAREMGRMVGVSLPLVPMEHHYMVTDALPALQALDREVPGVLDLDGEIYLRQEGKGMLLGVYESPATPWAVAGTPWEYGEFELLPSDLDRLGTHLERAFQRYPEFGSAGIRRVVNGPFTFTPDGNPLVGPVPGLKNYWAACGVMAGFSQGGGVGLTLAQWIVNGEPEGDIFAMDVSRFGPYATPRYTLDKASEFYSRRFQIAYPNEHWLAGRHAKTSGAHGQLVESGAVFGVSYGMEYPKYFARHGEEPVEQPSLRRSNAFEAVREECLAARASIGLLDISSFAKYEMTGPGVGAWLDYLLAGQLPKIGRVRLTPMLSPSGRLLGDLITMRLADERFLVSGSGYLQSWHMRWFDHHGTGAGVRVMNMSDALGGLAIVGPRSGELLKRITAPECGNAELPFMGVAEVALGFAPAILARLSVTGELGYEIHVPQVHLSALLHHIIDAANGLNLAHIGMYALNSLRLEKGFGIWSREFSPDYSPRMSGLDRYIAYDKGSFIGRDAALRDRFQIPSRRLVLLAVESADCDASGYEPLWLKERLVGFVTSGGYGHCAGTSLAMAYVDSAIDPQEANLMVPILGDLRRCRILDTPPIDPRGERMRVLPIARL